MDDERQAVSAGPILRRYGWTRQTLAAYCALGLPHLRAGRSSWRWYFPHEVDKWLRARSQRSDQHEQ
jgi:hypothetical protein